MSRDPDGSLHTCTSRRSVGVDRIGRTSDIGSSEIFGADPVSSDESVLGERVVAIERCVLRRSPRQERRPRRIYLGIGGLGRIRWLVRAAVPRAYEPCRIDRFGVGGRRRA